MIFALSDIIEGFGGPAVFRYITARALFAFLTAFLFGIYAGRLIINTLYKKGFRSSERSYGDINTQSKSGTPIMGGFILLAASLVAILLWCRLDDICVLASLLCMLWFFGIGAYDDIQKVRGKDADAGLSRVGKYLAQFGMGALLGVLIVYPLSPALAPFQSSWPQKFTFHCSKWRLWTLAGSTSLLPLWSCHSSPTPLISRTEWMALVTVPSLLVFLVFGIFAYVLGHEVFANHLLFQKIAGVGELNVFVLHSSVPVWLSSGLTPILPRSLWGFRVFDAWGRHRSRVALHQAGSLFVLVGAIFVAELFSTLIQERYGLKKGRRIFYRAPFHHTLQHHGLSETKIVTRVWIIATVCAALALITLKVR